MTYRFVGTFADLGDGRMLTHFGDSIELNDAEAAMLVGQRVALVPDAAFAKAGFTAEELAEYSFPDATIPDGHPFHAKRKQSWMTAHDLRESLSKGE